MANERSASTSGLLGARLLTSSRSKRSPEPQSVHEAIEPICNYESWLDLTHALGETSRPCPVGDGHRLKDGHARCIALHHLRFPPSKIHLLNRLARSRAMPEAADARGSTCSSAPFPSKRSRPGRRTRPGRPEHPDKLTRASYRALRISAAAYGHDTKPARDSRSSGRGGSTGTPRPRGTRPPRTSLGS